MSKCYPVIIYPSLITKFIAQNSLPTLSSGQFRNQNKVDSKANSNCAATSKPTAWFPLLIVCSIEGVLIVFSFTLLSPSWLVGIGWGLMLLGACCFWSNSIKLIETANTAKRKKRQEPEPLITLRSVQREQQLRKILDNKVLVSTKKSLAKAGVSEQRFFQILKQLFPNIKQGIEFEIPDFSHPYSADFVLQHESGLCIDIEVDEPYVGDTKAPHHCVDGGKDDLRNEFFTSRNWVVIRFSELQVVLHPQSCCKEIAKVVARIAGDRTVLSQLQQVPELPPDPMWTIKQAQAMARNNYRQTYLPRLAKS